jgi:UDP-glucose 4-epimerase
MSFSPKKILVTGGAGFIGSHITDALLQNGHEVHVLDNLSSGRRENLPADVPLFVHDIRDADSAALFATHRYDVLVHHAAQLDVRASVADPEFDAQVNIGGFLHLLEAGRKHGLQKVIFASTGGAVYGDPVYAPQDEQHPLTPLSPYGIAKLTAERYLYFYERQYGLSTVCLRYANVYGPRQSATGEAGVVAIFTSLMLEGQSPVINGDGTQTRDYVYVGDVVRANLAALSHEGSDTFNVGTGRETSVNDLCSLLQAATGAPGKVRHGLAKPGEQQRSVLDASLAETELHWTPKVSLSEGLSRTVDWFRSARAAAHRAPAGRRLAERKSR